MSRETLRARLVAATPGPWKHRRGYPADRFHPEGYGYVQFGPTEAKAAGLGTDQLAKADAEFIAAARQDIPALLAVADAAADTLAGLGSLRWIANNAHNHALPEFRVLLESAEEDWRKAYEAIDAALAALDAQP